MVRRMLADGSHPIWSVIRLVILMVALVVILYLTASRFDSTELKTILWMFFAAAGVEGTMHKVFKGLNKE